MQALATEGAQASIIESSGLLIFKSAHQY